MPYGGVELLFEPGGRIISGCCTTPVPFYSDENESQILSPDSKELPRLVGGMSAKSKVNTIASKIVLPKNLPAANWLLPTDHQSDPLAT